MNKNGSSNTTLASSPVILPLGFLRSRGGGPDLSGFGSKTSALYGDSSRYIGIGNDGQKWEYLCRTQVNYYHVRYICVGELVGIYKFNKPFECTRTSSMLACCLK